MKTSSKRRRRRHIPAPPLSATVAARLGPCALRLPTPITTLHQMPRMPSPPRCARDVLALLTAATGLALAARSDVAVELLPGSPTTVLITSNGKAHAAFVLPVPHDEVLHALGRPINDTLDVNVEGIWQEDYQANMLLPDAALQAREEAWLEGGDHAC